MTEILVQCSNKECGQIMLVDEPEYPPKFDAKKYNIFGKIVYVFGCGYCGELNSVDLPLNSNEV